MQAEENSSLEYQVFKQNAGRKNNTYLRWNLLKNADQDSQFDKLVTKSDAVPTVKGNKDEESATRISGTDNSVTKGSIIKNTLCEKKEAPEIAVTANGQEAASASPLLKPRTTYTSNNGGSILDKLAGHRSSALPTTSGKAQTTFSRDASNKTVSNNKDSAPPRDNKKTAQHTISFSLQAKAIEAQQRVFDLKKKAALAKDKASISSMLEHRNNSCHAATPDIHAVLQSKIGASANGRANLFSQMQNAEPVPPARRSSISEVLRQKENKGPKITISNSDKEHIDFSLRAKALEAAQRSKELKLNALAVRGSSIKETLEKDQKDQKDKTTSKVSPDIQSSTENKRSFDIRPVSQQGQFSALFTCKNKEASVTNEASLKDIFHRIESCQ